MTYKQLGIVFLLMVNILGVQSICHAQEMKSEAEIEVALRMIGHQVLLNHGDSTSRVLAISKEGDRYRIPLEACFQFKPGALVETIDRVVMETGVAEGYLVQMELDSTRDIIYSYAAGTGETSNIIPCATREQPSERYNLLFTILEIEESLVSNETGQSNYLSISLLIIPVLLIIAWFSFLSRKKEPEINNPHLISIGGFRFDKRSMKLSYADNTVELTHKEADLLTLLHSSANTTLEREHMLKSVWGDDGDYVGRTLDVFISKLRKKLEADPNVKIANIRGVGYKLVLNDA